MVPRSYLYVPGDRPEKLERAFQRGADALIVDLEDAVAPSVRTDARRLVARWLRERRPPPAVEVWVRINPGPDGVADLAAFGEVPWLTGVVAAKTESRNDLEALDLELAAAESRGGLEPGSLGVVPLLESASAVLDAPSIARGPRVRRLQLGEADLRADTGIDPDDDERELLVVRTLLVLASAAASIDPPVGPVSTDYRDLAKLRVTTRSLARLGFVGRGCIHPAQVEVVNEVFTPDAASVRRARDLLERFDRGIATGAGVVVDDAGRMVDEAVVRSARRTIGLVR